MKRWILAGGVGAVVAVAGGVLFLSRNLDHIVREQIEVRGSAALGTAVHVGSVELDLREGSGHLRDLRVENPPGFSGGDLLSFGSVSLVIDAKSALAVASGRSHHLIIDEVSVEDPRARVVVEEDGSSNVQALQAGSSRNASTNSEPHADGPPLLLTLRRVSVGSVVVSADTRALDGKQHELRLPDFSMREVGGPEGSPAGKVGASLAAGFATRLATRVASRAAARELDRVIDKNLGGAAGEVAKGLLDKVLGGP